MSKWRIPALVMLALIALPVLALGPEYWSPRSPFHQPPPHADGGTAYGDQKARHQNNDSSEASPQNAQRAPKRDQGSPASARDWQEGTQKAITRYTYRLMWFTGVLAAATIGLFVVTLIGAVSAKRSADALVSAERAHLFVRIHLQSVQEQITHASMLEAKWDDGHLEPRPRVSYVIKNFGKTPAILREINHTLDLLPQLPTIPSYSDAVGLPDQRVLAEKDESLPIECVCSTKECVAEPVWPWSCRSALIFERPFCSALISGRRRPDA